MEWQSRATGVDVRELKFAGDEPWSWVQVQIMPGVADKEFLTREFDLPPEFVDHLVDGRFLPELQREDDTILLNLQYEPSSDVPQPTSLHLAIMPDRFISFSRGECKVQGFWFERCEAVPDRIAKNPYDLFYVLCDEILDRQFKIVDRIEDELDEMEDGVLEGGDEMLPKIIALKRRANELRRLNSPFRDALNRLLRPDMRPVPDHTRRHLHEAYEQSLRVIERIEICRETIADLVEVQQTVRGNKLNKVMMVLTVISTCFMTVGLISGWYGMNFKHMPELSHPLGYWITMAVAAGAVGLELLIFKLKGWI
ncbi:MAG: magnesium transporter CorA family protein [Chthonomonas sp.]|nr:magnesium transporter CorA family protein [Chthonomonas sp.]